MLEQRLTVAFLVLALGCTTSRAAPTLAQESMPASRVIRFGDPPALAYDAPFFPEFERDPAVPAPDAILGVPVGSRTAHHAEILAAFRAMAAASPRVRIEPYGRTHEGRELLVAVISSPANLARLDAIRADLGKLADPRGVPAAETERIVKESPAVAWLGYSIHGDETSGADASLVIGHLLAAGQGQELEDLLASVVVVIDPCLNPDGRERIVGLVEQSAGRTPNLDWASMQRGRWPFGRGNHYLFDMNRDWMTGTQPETQGRWAVARSFHPQLFVDAHEMGSLDTFLFYPQARPVNPNLPPKLLAWQRAYAEDAARAFDAQGWSYYSREWADAWAPFYSDAWGSLAGGTGILYEQASTAGFALRRNAGEVLTYREAVHHQAVASLSNLRTLATRRADALRDTLENARAAVDPGAPGNERALVVVPGRNADREQELLRILTGQGIEVFRTTGELRARDAQGVLGASEAEHAFLAGAWLVPACQPLRAMVHAYLDFDTRMPLEDLRREREELELKGRSRVYDVTAWSLPLALDLDAWWCTPADAPRERLAPAAPAEVELVGPAPAVGWLVSAADDAALAFVARALESGLAVNASDEALSIAAGGRRVALPAWSFLVRRAENGGDAAAIEARVLAAARAAGLRTVVRSASGLAPDDSPDLGGQHFDLLARPRVALVGNSPIAEDSYGHLWHELDAVLGVPCTLLDAQSLGQYDLRRYNVLVLPPHRGGLDAFLAAQKDALQAWVRAGGVLVACGNSAASLSAKRVGLSQVALREDSLANLTPYRLAAERERASRSITIDEGQVWNGKPTTQAEAAPAAGVAPPARPAADPDDPYAEEKVPEERDRWLANFSPQGAFLRGLVDPQSWIARGAGPELAVFFSGSEVFLSKPPVRTAVRLAEADRLRLSGLLWPEARERIAESAWLTVERVENGAIVLFADVPAFRGYHRATGRLFANAVVLGPGLGGSPARDW
jgi:hypothetical protein